MPLTVPNGYLVGCTWRLSPNKIEEKDVAPVTFSCWYQPQLGIALK